MISLVNKASQVYQDACLRRNILKYTWTKEQAIEHEALWVLKQRKDFVFDKIDIIRAGYVGNEDVFDLIYNTFNPDELNFKCHLESRSYDDGQPLGVYEEYEELDDWSDPLYNACMDGFLEIFKVLTKHTDENLGIYFEHACDQGHLDIAMFIHENFEFDEFYALDWATQAGHFDVVKFLIETRKCRISDFNAIIACKAGNLRIVTLFLENGLLLNENCIDKIAYSGNFELLKYVFDKGNRQCTGFAIDAACNNASLEMVKFLHFNFPDIKCTSQAMDSALSNGNLELLKFLHENRNEGCSANGVGSFSIFTNLECLQFINDNRAERCPKNYMGLAIGNTNGNFELVKFLYTNNWCVCDFNSIMAAVFGGHVEILKYLYERRNEDCIKQVFSHLAPLNRIIDPAVMIFLNEALDDK